MVRASRNRSQQHVTMLMAPVAYRFPEQKDQIRKLIGQDDTFRSLCEEYSLANIAISSFNNEQDQQSNTVAHEYQVLIAELESEILDFLEANR